MAARDRARERARARERRRLERRAERRRRLLAAALGLIAERGFNQVSVDDVVACAHTSKSSFYDFWRSREELAETALDEHGDRLLAAVAEASLAGSDHRARMRAGLARFVSACTDDRAFARLLLVESIGVSPAVSAARERIQDRFARMIEAEVSASALADPFYAQVDAGLFARALVGAAEESAAHLLETEGRDAPSFVRGLSTIFAPAPPGPSPIAAAVDRLLAPADAAEPPGTVAP